MLFGKRFELFVELGADRNGVSVGTSFFHSFSSFATYPRSAAIALAQPHVSQIC